MILAMLLLVGVWLVSPPTQFLAILPVVLVSLVLPVLPMFRILPLVAMSILRLTTLLLLLLK